MFIFGEERQITFAGGELYVYESLKPKCSKIKIPNKRYDRAPLF